MSRLAQLDQLARLFYPSLAELGDFTEVAAEEMPAYARRLLAHQEHMTVTVEAFHGSQVDVQVLQAFTRGNHYARKILLARQSDGRIVQFGLVRLDLRQIDAEVRREIESQGQPLGRILIEHNVLREVELLALWRVRPGNELRQLLALSPEQTSIYGRSALIHCNGEPAVDLLEIVVPG